MEDNNMQVVKMIELAKNAGADVEFDCPACEKKFQSMKALGGHKRVHVEKSNKRNHEAMETPSASASVSAVAEETGEKPPSSFPCPICPLAFPSAKSLHGHMRKHSDRGWRGMNPPPSPTPTPPPPSPPSLNDSSSSSTSQLVGGGENSNSHTHVCACGRSFTYHHDIIGEADNAPPPPGAEDDGEGEDARKPKRVLIDLNELPPPSSDDEAN